MENQNIEGGQEEVQEENIEVQNNEGGVSENIEQEDIVTKKSLNLKLFIPIGIVTIIILIAVFIVVNKSDTTPNQEQDALLYELPNGSVEKAVEYLTATAQTRIPDFNLDYDSTPRDLLVDNAGSTPSGNLYDEDELKKHSEINDCWISKSNRVYDITAYLLLTELHKSAETLKNYCGTDIATIIDGSPVEPGSLNTARVQYALAEFYIGYSTTKGETADWKTYKSPGDAFQFSYPSDLILSDISIKEIPSPWGILSSVPYPEGSVEIPSLFIVSRVPYSDISSNEPIYNYTSCCSGERYWYDSQKKEWQSNIIKNATYDKDGNSIPDPKTPNILSQNGVCSLEQKFGSNVFYRINSGDEGIPTLSYYFIMTDQGYAIRFEAPYDAKKDYSSYAESARPSQETLDLISQVLSSVTLSNDVKEVKATCI